ncbi:hypothetical protein KUCAC02_034297 [Chaenocephalus aceratus]|nr:hypothetical protein KUCAC02_034297 [Chaenocephalus aceratus]
MLCGSNQNNIFCKCICKICCSGYCHIASLALLPCFKGD